MQPSTVPHIAGGKPVQDLYVGVPVQVEMPESCQTQLVFAAQVADVVSFGHGLVGVPEQSRSVESQMQPAAAHVALSKCSSQKSLNSSTHVPGAAPDVQPGIDEQQLPPLHELQLV